MTTAPRVHLSFAGCRLNEAEVEAMARQLAARGAEIVADAAHAETVIVNTCAVTQGAERNSRQMLLQAYRANPGAQIIATGCYAELDGARVGGLPGITRVIGNRDKDNLVQSLDLPEVAVYDREPLEREAVAPGTRGRTRAFIKVQDGCDNRCTFCVTTLARGAGRSRAVAEIIDEINSLSALGYQEVVLTGVHLGSYGHDSHDPRGLRGLVEAVLSSTAVPRIRLSSLEPWDLNPEFFELWADPRLCPHLHLPLQAGCDATLRRMARRTSRESFTALVEAARRRIPDLTLTGDWMVGFPGETDVDFQESAGFIEQMRFARMHVFAYSRRPGTAAATMPGQIAESVKKERLNHALALSARLWEGWQQRHLGCIVDVLWESAHGASQEGWIWSGLTGNYLRVFTISRDSLQNMIARARLESMDGDELTAVLV